MKVLLDSNRRQAASVEAGLGSGLIALGADARIADADCRAGGQYFNRKPRRMVRDRVHSAGWR